MDRNLQKDKTRTSYFGNVKTRLGSKLSADASQASQFSKQPREAQPQPPVALEPTASSQQQQQRQQLIVGRPLTHIPHIRNPKLRQYYLQGTLWDPNDTSVRQQQTGGLSDDNTNSRELPVNTVFSVSSQFHRVGTTSAAKSCSSTPAPLISGELVVLRGKHTSRTQRSSPPRPDRKLNASVEAGSSDTLAAQAQSPSPEAEYDKLLDVEAVPMPDGQLCLLALPPECCQGEGPDAPSYLKLFCRYITDRKGVVLGILLVTPNKIFFDPCKTHSLVKEHGCEEYLLSLSVDALASVSFCSDISHVHFNCSQQRRKGRTMLQKLKSAQSRAGGVPDLRGTALRSPSAPSGLSRPCLGPTREVSESRDTVGALGAAVLSSAATFCCGGPDEPSHVKTPEAGTSSEKSRTAAPTPSTSGGSGTLMFVRLRVQPSGVGERQLGKPRRDVWFALSQESSDELYAYLTACRPDLCVLEGGEEDGEAEHDEEFVLIKDKDDEEEVLQTHRSSGDDWEMVLMDDSGDKPAVPSERDPEGLNNIVENSHVLEASHVRELSKELPPRTVGHSWQLTYSTSLHGSSLKSLYRKLSSTESPVLIVIKDALDEIFGAFLSHPLRPSEAFYGTGETFLFMLHPRFKCFRWTGENSFFIKGDLDSFAIGGGSGHFGLWVDENLYLGRSSPCFTFNNCCLSETDDFRVMELEVWTFG